MLRNVDAEDEEHRSDSHVHTNIRQIWRSIDVEQCGFKPRRCHQAYITTPSCVSPAAVFSAAPDCRGRQRLPRFFARQHFFRQHGVFCVSVCLVDVHSVLPVPTASWYRPSNCQQLAAEPLRWRLHAARIYAAN